MARIYKIYPTIEHDENDVYIGCTTQSLYKRMIEHRYDWRSGRGRCTSGLLFDKYGNKNLIMELIEECDYTQRKEREQHHIDLHNGVNAVNALPPTPEVAAEMMRGYVKKFREKSESIECECGGTYRKYHKQTHFKSEKHMFFVENEERLIREKGKSGTYEICSCGSKVKFEHRCTHLRTEKHKKFVETGIKPNNCPCGGKYTEGGTGIYTHRQTARHKQWEQTQQEASVA